MKTLTEMLSNFVTGPDRSREAAARIESEMLRLNLDEDPRFEGLLDMLASYQPGGGEYLYNEEQMLNMIRNTLRLLPAI